jgi:putative ABC transport system ATP-binding protein
MAMPTLTANLSSAAQNPEALRTLDVGLFQHFPKLRRVDVQVAGPRGQSAARLSPQQTAPCLVTTMTEAVIEIEKLRFRWSAGDDFCLDIPSFEARAGERVFLYGPSGSGKSTLLGLLGGVLVPECGRLRLLGTELTRLQPSVRDRFRADHVGFLFQQFNLIPYLSVIDNVLLSCRFSAPAACPGDGSRGNSLHAEARRLLKHLDLEESLHRREVTRLSVGQQQRVAAARALIGRPEIVIADEPTSALDAERQGAFLDLLARECAAAGSTLLFVSHDRRLAAGFDRELSLASISRTDVGQQAA